MLFEHEFMHLHSNDWTESNSYQSLFILSVNLFLNDQV